MSDGVLRLSVKEGSPASREGLARIVRMNATCEGLGDRRRTAVTFVAVLSVPLLGQRLGISAGSLLDRLVLTRLCVAGTAGMLLFVNEWRCRRRLERLIEERHAHNT